MWCKESKQKVHEVMCSADLANRYVRKIVAKETRGWGDQENAMRRIGSRYGISFWSLNNIRIGRAKTVDAGLFARIRAAYVDVCEEQLRRLQHEIAVEKAINPHVSLEDIESEAETLAALFQTKKDAKT
ncbi:MAG: hypothetical protein LBE54_11870 [Brucellaceae bacterium]|jgi:hypothetical protein|nr:hypothetical protein [Brucellaceae bacterium]